MNLMQILAQATQPASGAQRPQWFDIFGSPLTLMFVIIIVMYLFMFRGKRNEEKKRQNMLAQLKRGDRVQTIGGVLGTVVEARDTEVLLKVDESSNTKIRFSRNAIHRVLEEEKSQ